MPNISSVIFFVLCHLYNKNSLAILEKKWRQFSVTRVVTIYQQQPFVNKVWLAPSSDGCLISMLISVPGNNKAIGSPTEAMP